MRRSRRFPEPLLLDREVWEAPVRLSDEDLYAQAGPDCRRAARPFYEPEDEQ